MSRQRLAIILTTVGGVILNGTLWGLALFVFERSQAAAILHYRADIGIDFVGEGKHITALPLAGSILLVLNLILGAALWRTDRLAAWILWGAVPILQTFLLIAFYFLWRANT